MSLSRQSSPTLRINNVNLHSPYNPELEAKKVIERQGTIYNPLAIIIIEPGLGYYIKIIKQKYPHCKIIAFHLSNGIKNQAIWSTECTWEPQDGNLNMHIASHLWQLAFPIVNTIENPAAQRINKSLYLTIKKNINHELHRLISYYTTIASFAKQWTINCVINCLQMKRKLFSLPYNTSSADTPIIIVGSGPSLNKYILEEITKAQTYCNIWCLSSAITILNYYNITPDVLITTDGGHWASYHLHDVPRQTTIAMPLTAKAHNAIRSNPIIFFNQQFIVENAIYDRLYKQWSLHTPARASVAASAMELAKLSAAKDIILIGIDFGFYDGKQSAYPHAFSSVIEQNTSILNRKESSDFSTFSESYTLEFPRVNSSIRMSHKHRLYREELEEVVFQCQSIKNIYQCMSVNPLRMIKQLTISELKQRIDMNKKKKLDIPTNLPANEDNTKFMPYRRNEIIELIEQTIKKIIHDIQYSSSLENLQPLREICVGLAYKQYIQTCNATLRTKNTALKELKQAVILQLMNIAGRHNQ